MDTIPAALSGGGVTGAIIIVCWLLYKCCEKRSSRCHSGCVDVTVSDGVPTAPPSTPNVSSPSQPETACDIPRALREVSPVLKPIAVVVEPAPLSV